MLFAWTVFHRTDYATAPWTIMLRTKAVDHHTDTGREARRFQIKQLGLIVYTWYGQRYYYDRFCCHICNIYSTSFRLVDLGLAIDVLFRVHCKDSMLREKHGQICGASVSRSSRIFANLRMLLTKLTKRPLRSSAKYSPSRRSLCDWSDTVESLPRKNAFVFVCIPLKF